MFRTQSNIYDGTIAKIADGDKIKSEGEKIVAFLIFYFIESKASEFYVKVMND